MNWNWQLSVGLVSTALVIYQSQVAVAISESLIRNAAKRITVEISVMGISGRYFPVSSGVIVEKNSSTYYVVTNYYTVENNDDYLAILPSPANSNVEEAEIVDIKIIRKYPNPGLALWQFTSQRNYDVAVPGDPTSLKKGETVYAAGFPGREGFRFVPVEITNERPVAVGQPLIYKQIQADNRVAYGMGGGPILNQEGQLVGINRAFLREEGGDVTGISVATMRETFPNIIFGIN